MDTEGKELQDLKTRLHRHLTGLLKALEKLDPEKRRQALVSISIKLQKTEDVS